MNTCLFRVGEGYAVSDSTLKKAKFFKDLITAFNFAQQLALEQGEAQIEWDDRPSHSISKEEIEK